MYSDFGNGVDVFFDEKNSTNLFHLAGGLSKLVSTGHFLELRGGQKF